MLKSWDPNFCILVPVQIVTFEEHVHSCCASVSAPLGLTPINCHMPFATEMDLQQLLDRRHFGCEEMCFQLLPFLIASAGVKKRPRNHVPQRIRLVLILGLYQVGTQRIPSPDVNKTWEGQLALAYSCGTVISPANYGHKAQDYLEGLLTHSSKKVHVLFRVLSILSVFYYRLNY